MFSMQWTSGDVERDRGWKPAWRASRPQPAKVLSHRVYRTALGIRVIQLLDAPGVTGPLAQSVFLPAEGDFVEFESWWVMGQTVHPESTYLMFPFDVPGARARLDLGGQAITAGEDQIPGVCFDYYTAQQWVDFSNDEAGVTVALPDNPMVQFGDFHFGHNQQRFELERAMLLGWVTNNYWETNFRAHQPGGVQARYRVYPHAGGFDPSAAQRAGLETAYNQPLLQHMGERPAEQVFPQQGSLLRLPESFAPDSPVFTLRVKPAAEPEDANAVIVRLYNAGTATETARVASGLLAIESAELCDLTENPAGDALAVQDGGVEVTIPAGRVLTLRLITSI
jgi:alpha-mannosidase